MAILVVGGDSARAIVAGLEADIAALSPESDLQQLVKANLITHDWKQARQKGTVTTSVVALGVRKGNPKAIPTWEDLAKPGVAVLYPSPKTSGGAMWDVTAIYGAGLKLARNADYRKTRRNCTRLIYSRACNAM
ncbi:MAG TPA: substrate-binding domain-containing protein [Nitrospiraceae bacterium]|nr:substrate-binding domain-containing protein [Nitrospiraceae bacterium]